MFEAQRKVRVTVPRGGGFTKGNRNTVGTSATPIATDFRNRSSGYYGVNSALPAEVPVFRKKAAVRPARHGKRCPGCGIETPLSGQCNQCWD